MRVLGPKSMVPYRTLKFKVIGGQEGAEGKSEEMGLWRVIWEKFSVECGSTQFKQ
jgi:hypothetical protein